MSRHLFATSLFATLRPARALIVSRNLLVGINRHWNRPGINRLLRANLSKPTLRADGGRGRIRTSVARKERQIYSLLVLATHPPVRTGNCQTSEHTLKSRRDTRSFELEMQEIACPCLEIRRPSTKNNSEISWRRDLNPRPSDYKSDALPTELRQRRSN